MTCSSSRFQLNAVLVRCPMVVCFWRHLCLFTTTEPLTITVWISPYTTRCHYIRLLEYNDLVLTEDVFSGLTNLEEL